MNVESLLLAWILHHGHLWLCDLLLISLILGLSFWYQDAPRHHFLWFQRQEWVLTKLCFEEELTDPEGKLKQLSMRMFCT